MTTQLNKPVSRVTLSAVRDRGAKFRQVVVTLQPGDLIGMRLKGTRYGCVIAISSVWQEAMIRQALAEKRFKAQRHKGR